MQGLKFRFAWLSRDGVFVKAFHTFTFLTKPVMRLSYIHKNNRDSVKD